MSQGTNVLGQLVQVPILLAAWGTAQYGEWLSLSAMVAYLSLLDFGVQTYSTNRLTKCWAVGDRAQYLRVLHSAWTLNVSLAATAFTLAFPLLMSAPFDRWLQLHVTGHRVALMAAILLAIQTIVALPFGLLIGIYRTVNEYPREQMMSIARQLIVILATVVTASAGGSVAAVAAAQLLAIALPGIYAWRDLGRRHPEVRIGFSHASREMALSFLHPSLLFLVLQLSGAAILQGTTLLAGGMFGSTAVATFVSLRTLGNLSQQGITSVRNALWPEIAAMDATGDHGGLRRLMALITKVSMMIWFSTAVVLHFEGASVLRVWSKGRIPFDSAVLHGVLLLFGSTTFWATASALLGASNRHRAMTGLYATSTVAGLSLAFAFSRIYGLSGLVFGIAVADILISAVWIPRLACRSIGLSFGSFAFQVVGRGVLASIPVVAVALLASRWLPLESGLIRAAVLGLITGTCALASLVAIYLETTEREHIRAVLRRILGR
jgi:O-antigen/teichoic acid export membrane protein